MSERNRRNVKKIIRKFQLKFIEKKLSEEEEINHYINQSVWESLKNNLGVRIFSYTTGENWSRKEDFT